MKDFDSNWLMSRMAKEKAAQRHPELHGVPHDAVEYESTLHDDIIDACRQRGWIVIHSRMDVPTTTAKGVCDFIIFASRSRVFLFECKNKNNKLTDEQRGFAMMADMLGFTVHVVRAFSEFLQVINQPESTTP